MSLARITPIIGSLYALMRNRLGLNVATQLGAQELSCTVAPDRRLVVLGHEPIAGFARDHGTVADEAAMLALHTLDSTTLLAEPRFVAPGDSCLRADDPGWRWHCIANHGQALSDWERRPLGDTVADAIDLLATKIGSSALDGYLSEAEAEEQYQPLLTNRTTLAKITESKGAPLWNGSAWPGGGSSGSGDPVIDYWKQRVAISGGTLGSLSQSRAQSLVTALRDAGLLRVVIRLDAWLGGDGYTAASIPLVDRFGRCGRRVGVADADWSESSGIAFSGASYIDSMTRPGDLGVAGNGGLGWWEAVATASGNVEPMGCYSTGDSQRFVLDLRSSLRAFRWGDPATGASSDTERAAGHYYGQRSGAASRTLYADGDALASNTSSDSASGVHDRTIWLGGSNSSAPELWTGRCLLAYLTDGTLTDTQIAALHTVLSDWLTDIGRE